MRACLGGRAFVIHVARACMLPVLRVRWIKREEGLDSWQCSLLLFPCRHLRKISDKIYCFCGLRKNVFCIVFFLYIYIYIYIYIQVLCTESTVPMYQHIYLVFASFFNKNLKLGSIKMKICNLDMIFLQLLELEKLMVWQQTLACL